MRILLATDAWVPQVNGVVRTLSEVIRELGAIGHRVSMVHPGLFRSIPCPFYPEIRLALGVYRRIGNIIEAFGPDAIHIATEGPIGLAARRWCLAHGYTFTTAFHTRFPEYLADRWLAPTRLTYALLRRFHRPAGAVMVPSASVRRELSARGFVNLSAWGRGVDPDLFNPHVAARRSICHGRSFCLLVASRRRRTSRRFSRSTCRAPRSSLAAVRNWRRCGRGFPRRISSAGAPMESSPRYMPRPMCSYSPAAPTLSVSLWRLPRACRSPPIRCPVRSDVVGQSGAGALDEDLRRAALAALTIPRERCRAHALNFTWRASASEFLQNLRPCRGASAEWQRSVGTVQ